VLSGVLSADVRHVLPRVVPRALAVVLRVLNAHPVLDVAMVASPHIERGYHSASMIKTKHTQR
jgi:hypothetical protein